MTPDLEALLKKHPPPLGKRRTAAGRLHLFDGNMAFFGYGCTDHMADLVIALANAHQPVERERYYTYQSCGEWNVVRRNDDGTTDSSSLPVFREGADAERHACEYAARLNAECEDANTLPEGSPFLCEHANECRVSCLCPPGCYCKSHTCKPAESAPPEPALAPCVPNLSGEVPFQPISPHDEIKIPDEVVKRVVPEPVAITSKTGEQLSKKAAEQWGPQPEPEVPQCPIAGCDKTYPHLHPSEPVVPERPWECVSDAYGLRVDDHAGDIAFCMYSTMQPCDAHEWNRRCGTLRQAVRAYNAEPHHERVGKLARKLAEWVDDHYSASDPGCKELCNFARKLQTELEKTDGDTRVRRVPG